MLKIDEILRKIDHLKFIGNRDQHVSQPIQINVNNLDPTAIMWVNDSNVHLIEQLNSGTIICSEKNTFFDNKHCNYIVSTNPRFTFKQILELFFVTDIIPFVSERAFVHPSTVMGKNCCIGHNVVIEEDCKIGDDVRIEHNTVVKSKTVIGDNVKIGCNCTIGGVGFGYEKDVQGGYTLMPHLGNVILMDSVEIGNNTCIDRAVMGSTILRENVKVDNLVHIAHGVTIGKNSLIIAHAMIGGSTQIGENVWVAPASSILNKRKIESDSVIGMGAVVIGNVNAGETIIGNPGKVLVKKRSD
jgi:UDP-3-O-[3-hydroxymyristoyl] glucosamine N-acyltransferase